MTAMTTVDDSTTYYNNEYVETKVLDELRGGFEKTLNVFGYVPLVSMVSGGIRVFYGKLALITTVALAAIHGLVALCKSDRHTALREYSSTYFPHYRDEVLHALANIVRGLAEVIPIFGNIATGVYDLKMGRFMYAGEKVRV